MTDKKATAANIPEPADLLADPPFRERFEQTAAALEAADLVRTMRRQALSASGLRGISQEELAQRVGISQPRISQIERAAGRDGIGYTLLRRIAHACGIEWGALVRDAIARLAIPVAEPARVVVAEPARGVIAEQARGVVMGGILPMPRFAPQAYLGHLVRDATGSLLGAIGSVLFDAAGATAAVRLLGSDVIVSCDRLVLDSRHLGDFTMTAAQAGRAGAVMDVGQVFAPVGAFSPSPPPPYAAPISQAATPTRRQGQTRQGQTRTDE
jgi:transcriptional regulator with XRE-family HTH domain